jgi:hypothetical protein
LVNKKRKITNKIIFNLVFHKIYILKKQKKLEFN